MENDNEKREPRVISIRNNIYKSILKRGEEETPDPCKQAGTTETIIVSFDPVKRAEQQELKNKQRIIDLIVKNTKSF